MSDPGDPKAVTESESPRSVTLRSLLSRAIDLLRDLRVDIVSISDPRRGILDDLIWDAEEALR